MRGQTATIDRLHIAKPFTTLRRPVRALDHHYGSGRAVRAIFSIGDDVSCALLFRFFMLHQLPRAISDIGVERHSFDGRSDFRIPS